MTINRREFIKYLTALTGMSLLPSCGVLLSTPNKKAKAQVVIIGGGVGGATVAKYLRLADSTIQVTLIEPKEYYHTCFMSNAVITGQKTMRSITHDYRGLAQYGIHRVRDFASTIDPINKTVLTKHSGVFHYDKLIVAPGVDIHHSAIEGYSKALSNTIAHGWEAGKQTLILQHQLKTLKKGGVIAISVPPKPFRCPPGPYERASLMAAWLKKHNPTAKILILDANDDFTKQALFIDGWQALYGYGTASSLIEWVPQKSDGRVVRVDGERKKIFTELDVVNADLINVIPPQTAGEIAFTADLVDETGWCPVDGLTFESKKHKDIHIIGDACIAGAMPKSAFAANSQAKVTAQAVKAEINAEPVIEPYYFNTCYSLVREDYGISITASYQHKHDTIMSIDGSKGTSRLSADSSTRLLEARYANSWYQSITRDIFA